MTSYLEHKRPDSIKVSEWYFKSQSSALDNRLSAAAAASDDTAMTVISQASDLQGDYVPITITADNASTVPAVHQELLPSDDETIMQVDSRVDNGNDNEN